VVALLAVIGLSGAVVWLALDRDRDRRGAPAGQRAQDERAQQASGDDPTSKKKIGKHSVVLENILGAGTGLTEGQVTKVIQAHIGELKECWRKAIERAPDIDGGTVTLMIDVEADGKSDVTMATQDGIGDAPLRQCLTAASSDWKYPKPNAEWGGAGFMATFRFKREK
jgi:hypothetical protein